MSANGMFSNLKDACAGPERCHAQRAGRAQQRAGVVRLQGPAHLPRQPERHQLRDGQHLRARPEGVPGHTGQGSR